MRNARRPAAPFTPLEPLEPRTLFTALTTVDFSRILYENLYTGTTWTGNIASFDADGDGRSDILLESGAEGTDYVYTVSGIDFHGLCDFGKTSFNGNHTVAGVTVTLPCPAMPR